MSEEHRNEPSFFSPLSNAKLQTWQSFVHLVNQILELKFVIAISNLLSCENAQEVTHGFRIVQNLGKNDFDVFL